MSARSTIAIVGGGIGGLATALALLREGIDVDVYEQAGELKEVGAGVQISANGTRVLYALGLESKRSSAWLRAAAQGDPPLEHRPDLEAVRSRRGVGRALRLPLRDDASARPACNPGRRDRATKPDAVHLGLRCVERFANGFLRADRVRHRRARGCGARDRRRRRAFDGARLTFRRRCARRCRAAIHRNCRVARAGGDRAAADAGAGTPAPTGSARADTSCTIRYDVAS